MELLKCSKNFITQFSQHMERKVHFLSLCTSVRDRERESTGGHLDLLLQSWPMLTSKQSSFFVPIEQLGLLFAQYTQYTRTNSNRLRAAYFLMIISTDFRFFFTFLFCFRLHEIKSESKREKLSLSSCSVAKNHSNQTPPVCRFGICSFQSH